MTFSVAFLLLAAGIVLGWRLRAPLQRAVQWMRRRTRKPVLLTPYIPEGTKEEGP